MYPILHDNDFAGSFNEMKVRRCSEMSSPSAADAAARNDDDDNDDDN